MSEAKYEPRLKTLYNETIRKQMVEQFQEWRASILAVQEVPEEEALAARDPVRADAAYASAFESHAALRDAAMKSKAWPFEEARRVLKRYEKKKKEKGSGEFISGPHRFRLSNLCC